MAQTLELTAMRTLRTTSLRVSRSSLSVRAPGPRFIHGAASSSQFVSQLPLRQSFASSSRVLQTPPPHINDTTVPIKQLTPGEYERIADEDMDTMHESLEELCEEYMTGAEVEYSSGVMTLITPHGTYVINKQPPNQQIWISSPISGPARFGYSPDGVWVHHRKEGVTLGALLDEELKQLAGQTEWKGVGLQ